MRGNVENSDGLIHQLVSIYWRCHDDCINKHLLGRHTEIVCLDGRYTCRLEGYFKQEIISGNGSITYHVEPITSINTTTCLKCLNFKVPKEVLNFREPINKIEQFKVKGAKKFIRK